MLNFLGLALLGKSPAGILLTLEVLVMYRIALSFEEYVKYVYSLMYFFVDHSLARFMLNVKKREKRLVPPRQRRTIKQMHSIYDFVFLFSPQQKIAQVYCTS